MELKVSRTQGNAILEKLHWPTHFCFREDNFAWSPSTNETAYVYFCNSTAHFKNLLDYGDVQVQSPSIIVSKVVDATSYNALIRVQRKSVLRLAIRASCCLYVLAQESFK